MRDFQLTAFLLLLLSIGQIHAQYPADAGGKALSRGTALTESELTKGRSAASFCANCHGVDGNSSFPEVPNLAGQNPSYLYEQLLKFATGVRKNEFMQQMIKVLSDEDKILIVNYYANQAVRPRASSNAALVAQGEGWYTKICFRCHGRDGRGSEKFARLAGQQPKYVMDTLQRYRNRSGERINPDMSANVSMLKDADIQAVAEFVSQMK